MVTKQNAKHDLYSAREQYQETNLYGGAITVKLPDGFIDVSSFREVPDHQEVYIHSTQASIIFDILERAEPPEHPCKTNEDALLYHYKDITALGHVRQGTEAEEESKIWGSERITIPSLGEGVPAYNLFATQHPIEQPPAVVSSDKPPVEFTGVLLTLIRLQEQKTDFLITVNVPHIRGEYCLSEVDLEGQHPGALLETAKEHRQTLLQSFYIEDWGLLVPE